MRVVGHETQGTYTRHKRGKMVLTRETDLRRNRKEGIGLIEVDPTVQRRSPVHIYDLGPTDLSQRLR